MPLSSPLNGIFFDSTVMMGQSELMRKPLLILTWTLPFLAVFPIVNYLSGFPGDPIGWLAVLLTAIGPAIWAKYHFLVTRDLLQTHPFQTVIFGSLLSSLVLTITTLIIGGFVYLLIPNFWTATVSNPGAAFVNFLFIGGFLLWVLIPGLFLSSIISSVTVRKFGH